MFKEFVMIKKENLKTGEKSVDYFTLKSYVGESKRRILDQLYRRENPRSVKNINYSFDETMYMSLPKFSDETVKEISKHLFLTAYAVVKKQHKNEKVIYFSLLKDTAIKYKNSLRAATVIKNNIEYRNPNIYVKEVKLILA